MRSQQRESTYYHIHIQNTVNIHIHTKIQSTYKD